MVRYNRACMIPELQADGYLPPGVHEATEAEATFRFGTETPRRRRLVLRLRRWIELARSCKARRFLVDGSFITAKLEPNDIDAVVLLSPDFFSAVEGGASAAIELEHMLVSRHPEELFAAEDEMDWNDWVEFFSRTREADGRRKGLVEVVL